MTGFNKVIIAGNMTRDPELRYTPDQKPVIDFTVAINQKRHNRTETLFMDCTAWENTAVSIAEFMKKGSPILVEGRLVREEWMKDDEKKHRTKVVATGVTFLGNKGDNDESESSQETEISF